MQSRLSNRANKDQKSYTSMRNQTKTHEKSDKRASRKKTYTLIQKSMDGYTSKCAKLWENMKNQTAYVFVWFRILFFLFFQTFARFLILPRMIIIFVFVCFLILTCMVSIKFVWFLLFFAWFIRSVCMILNTCLFSHTFVWFLILPRMLSNTCLRDVLYLFSWFLTLLCVIPYHFKCVIWSFRLIFHTCLYGFSNSFCDFSYVLWWKVICLKMFLLKLSVWSSIFVCMFSHHFWMGSYSFWMIFVFIRVSLISHTILIIHTFVAWFLIFVCMISHTFVDELSYLFVCFPILVCIMSHTCLYVFLYLLTWFLIFVCIFVIFFLFLFNFSYFALWFLKLSCMTFNTTMCDLHVNFSIFLNTAMCDSLSFSMSSGVICVRPV